jgi:hypothetical protein
MALGFTQFPGASNLPRSCEIVGLFTGAGAANLTKVYGKQLTCTRQGVGVYRFTLSNKPSQVPIVVAQTQGTAALITTLGAWNVSGKYIDVTTKTDAGVATELSTAEKLSIIIVATDASSL